MMYRRKSWINTTRAALTYEEWAHGVKILDKEPIKIHEANLYDIELMRNKF